MHIVGSNVKGVGRGAGWEWGVGGDCILAYKIKRFSDANLIELQLIG